MSSPVVFDSVNYKYSFPSLNDLENFSTADYDAHIKTKIEFRMHQVFISMRIHERNTLNRTCELERTQLLTVLAMSVQNAKFAGYLLTGNRSNFLYVEVSTAWLYVCPQYFLTLYETDRNCDPIPKYFQFTVTFIEIITRQNFVSATHISFDNNPQNVIAIDLDNIELMNTMY